ncbi:hypothetical protein EI42_03836 [Thermosporothrix hazakensis]|uniref:Uncharacterized protein n=2 Tax=Thermosporothrix TaxID=768650 RepID=A0A326U5G7_THEHA|nr:hypothetical protein EI42_03836 [Thermosporothrix hazakensis]
MQKLKSIPYLTHWLLVLSLVLVLVLVTACGSRPTTGGQPAQGSPTATPPATTPAPDKGDKNALTNGCPSDITMKTVPSKADVIVKRSDIGKTIVVHKGNIIEFDLPFGQRWLGPTATPTILEIQQPAGFAASENKACIWRFVARDTGKIELDFTARAICRPGKMCAMYIMDLPFTIEVQ